MGPMDVLHLVRPAAGGMRNHVVSLAERLDRARFRVCVFGPLDPATAERLQAKGVDVGHADVPGGLSPALLRAAAAVRRVVTERQPAILHCHGLVGGLVGRLALEGLPSGVRAPAVVLTVHNLPDWPPSRLRRPLQRYLERRFARRTARYIAVSLAVRDSLVSSLGVSPDKVSVIYNGIDLARFAAASPPRAAARAEVGLPAGVPVVAAVARLAPEKGIDVLLEAFVRLGQRATAHLAIAGDGPLRGVLERRARQAGVAERVHWLGHVTDPLPLLRAADVVAVPSRAEGLGVACIEAMAAGRAVVASAAGGLGEVVQHRVNGLLVPAGDAMALRAALERLLGDELLRRRLGERARQDALQRFSVDAMVRNTTRLYEWLVEAPGGRRPRWSW